MPYLFETITRGELDVHLSLRPDHAENAASAGMVVFRRAESLTINWGHYPDIPAAEAWIVQAGRSVTRDRPDFKEDLAAWTGTRLRMGLDPQTGSVLA